MQILQLTQQEDCGLDEITTVVRSDPALMGRILKVANSFCHRGEPASTTPLEDAVLRIGFNSLRDLVLGFSLVSAHTISVCHAFDFAEFWHSSLGRAVAAQYLTEMSGRGGASESYVCGLLCGIGRLGLASAHPERYGALLESPEVTNLEALVGMETREFGIHHRELTEALMVDWGFPTALAEAAARYRQPEGPGVEESVHLRCLGRTLRLADGIVAALDDHATLAEDLPAELRADLTTFLGSEVEIGAALASVGTQWKEWGTLLNVASPSASRLDRTSTCSVREPPGRVAPLTFCAVESGVQSGVTLGRGTPPLLLLEADDATAATFERWLLPAGEVVLRARTVLEALRLTVTYAPRIIIAHGTTDDAEALELCRALRTFEDGRKAFFILVTTNGDPARLLTTFDAEVDDYLVLPIADSAGLLRLRAAQRVVELRCRVEAQEGILQMNLADLSVVNRKLHLAVMTDALTQLPNRRHAEETLRDAWNDATLRDKDLSLIIGDIDDFKLVNDEHGHSAGDMVLVSVARILRRDLRSSDTACRLGGDEFLVICPDTDLQGVECSADRLRRRVAATDIAVFGAKHRVTISLGVASRRQNSGVAPSAEFLLKAADDAAYVSKRAGRNRISTGIVHAPA